MLEKERFRTIKKFIQDYENGILSTNSVIEKINSISTGYIDEYCLNNYWRSENLDDLVKRISAEPIANWIEIDDKRALKLIKNTLDNISDSSMLRKNSEALEKCYKKSEGTLTQLIFHSSLTTPKEILIELKKDTVRNN